MNLHISLAQIIFRMVIVAVIAAFIGWDRQKKNRPAGVQVHMLVAIGAAIAALIQQELTLTAMKFAADNSSLSDFVANDAARLLAAVVSGIGFLGAGTIVVTKRVVRGLSTAASLWATASIGLAVGLGYYQIALFGGIAILGTLILVERGLKTDMGTDIEVTIRRFPGNDNIVEKFFDQHHVRYIPKDYNVNKNEDDTNTYVVSYAIKRPHKMTYPELSEMLLQVKEVESIELTSY